MYDIECNGTKNDSYYATWRSPRLAVTYLSIGTIYVAIYIPCIKVMTSKELWINSCYKIMFSVGVLDLCTLMISCFIPAIFMLIPFDYICHQTADHTLRNFCQLFWNSYCFVTVTLMLNRCVFMLSPENWSKKLFDGNKVWIWIAIAALYGLVFVAVYASPYGHIVFHSGYGIYWWPKTDVYGIKFTTFNNTATAVLVPVGYLILCLILRQKKSACESSFQKTSTSEQRLLVQAILICALTCTASLFYYLAPKFTNEVVVFQVLHVIWISSNGCNGLIYLALNKTIRSKVLRMLARSRYQDISRTDMILLKARNYSSHSGVQDVILEANLANEVSERFNAL